MNREFPKTVFSVVAVCFVTSLSVCRGQHPVVIYTMDRDGSNAQLFHTDNHLEWNGSASWSHDGTRIAFDASTREHGNGENHIVVRAVQGAGDLTMALGSAPVWSPDDSEIAYMVQKTEGDDLQHGIWIINAEGPNPRFVCPGYRPCWSPDGKSIAYSDPQSGRNTLFIRNLETGAERKILDKEYRMIPGASFSPDGNFITYIGYHEGADDYDADLGIIDLRGEKPKLTIRLRDRIGWHPKWSPDGRRILFFTVDERRAFRIATLSPFGADKPVVLKDQADYFYNADASWSPDGSRIVFSSDRYAVVDERLGLIGLAAGLIKPPQD